MRHMIICPTKTSYCLTVWRARRTFVDAQSNDKGRVDYALVEIGKLYRIEQECRQQQFSVEQTWTKPDCKSDGL